MAEDDRDILGKADALLRRHVPPRTGSGSGADVPVLTELITPGGTAPPPEPPPEEEPPAPPATDGGEDELRRQLVAEIVDTVQSRLAHDVEQRLADQVLSEVRASVAAALEDLRQDIARAVGEAVGEALARHPKR